MALESASYATQLSASNPASSDPRSQGDDHLRMVKTVIKNELSAANKQWAYTGHSVTRRSTAAFTVASDVTEVYTEGRRVKVTGSSTGTVYGTISSSTYTSETSVNISLDSGTFANETLTTWVGVLTNANDALPRGNLAIGSGQTGGTGSAGSGNQYVEMTVNGVTYKVLHDGTV